MRTYKEICGDLQNAKPGKEARKLHKELKAYGDGMVFTDRYPLFFPVISIFVAMMSMMTAILLMLPH